MNTVTIKGLEFDRTILLQMMGAIWQMTIEPSEQAARHVIQSIVNPDNPTRTMVRFTTRMMELRRVGASTKTVNMDDPDPIDFICVALMGARMRCDTDRDAEESGRLAIAMLNLFAKIVTLVEPAVGMGTQQLADASHEAYTEYLKKDSINVADEVMKKMMAGGVGG